MRSTFLFATLVVAACTTDSRRAAARADTLVVYDAASLAGPMRPLLDTFAARTGAVVQEEHGASLELARRVLDLKRVPDVIALADRDVFPALLMPSATAWYATFARDRMAIAYTRGSRHADQIRSDNWREILQRADVRVGRSDPVQAPAGYRTLITYALAERFYAEPGLARRLAERTPPSQIRGNAAELTALLSTGELDYIVDYESVARSHGFKFVSLPADIDLGDVAHAAAYGGATVSVPTRKGAVAHRGEPILFAVSVPRSAPHGRTGIRFVRFLLGREGREMLRRGNMDTHDGPVFTGDTMPMASTPP